MSKTLIFIDVHEYGKFQVFLVSLFVPLSPRILMNVCCLKYVHGASVEYAYVCQHVVLNVIDCITCIMSLLTSHTHNVLSYVWFTNQHVRSHLNMNLLHFRKIIST